MPTTGNSTDATAINVVGMTHASTSDSVAEEQSASQPQEALSTLSTNIAGSPLSQGASQSPITSIKKKEEKIDYEEQRRRNILENQRLMMELGLNPIAISRSFPTSSHDKNKDFDNEEYEEQSSAPPKSSRAYVEARKRRPKIVYQSPVATRSSKRIRGQVAEEFNVDLEALEKGIVQNLDGDEEDTVQESSRQPPPQLGAYSRSLWKGRKQTTGFVVELEIPCACAPLTLGSIATTVWEQGTIYQGRENRLKYWSGKGSLYRHPYPIGYKAEKFYFRDRYKMEIREGPDGPIFIVESVTGKVYQGSSPTQPWTMVCLASYSKGTRISGPLFFGFSDPITQKMIESLPGYESWETEVAKENQRLALLELEQEQEQGDEEKDASDDEEAEEGAPAPREHRQRQAREE